MWSETTGVIVQSFLVTEFIFYEHNSSGACNSNYILMLPSQKSQDFFQKKKKSSLKDYILKSSSNRLDAHLYSESKHLLGTFLLIHFKHIFWG